MPSNPDGIAIKHNPLLRVCPKSLCDSPRRIRVFSALVVMDLFLLHNKKIFTTKSQSSLSNIYFLDSLKEFISRHYALSGDEFEMI